MTREEAIKEIYMKYYRYGVSLEDIEREVAEGEDKGFSYHSICTGLRMAYSNVFDTEELFTVEDMAEAMGVPQEEVIAVIEEARAQAEAEGRDADEIAYKTEVGEISRFIIPSGFLF